ncbi:uncharacterized protein LOC110453846 isoform X2 [Mizuhopecten yessoensis]|uniref:uncharacterized protein LOC110453846 isoform X2 n=1 Tax=Mizuhopecten yessoensis TaxID=6573 RepID=UPI000B45DE85|nr:uncharacterized protein LOC110453846 isoform X2 [Mizuhopecten yessoensis]
MRSVMLYGLSCCRFAFTRSTNAKQWTGVSRLVLMGKSSVYSPKTEERHFTMLTRGRSGSQCLLNALTKKIQCQYENDQAKGLFTVANLLTCRKVAELEDILTPKAYRQVLLNHEKLTAEHYSVLRSILAMQKKPSVVYKIHDTEVEVDVSKDVPEVLVKLKLIVMFLQIHNEKEKGTTSKESVGIIGGFERVYTSKLNDSTWSKGEEFDMNRIEQTGLAALDLKSDDYWRINGITFGVKSNNDFKLSFV